MRDDLTATREEHRDRLRAAGREPYPTWHGRTHTAATVHEEYGPLSQQAVTVTVAGRVRARREHGGIHFLDLHDATGSIQVLCRADLLGAESFQSLADLDVGDIIAATGSITKTRAGEVSIEARTWTPLTKALVPLPSKRAGLQDEEERARHRELDLLANTETRRVFDVRTRILRGLREFLAREGFTEVETPVLQHLAGGASARPFRTHHAALNLDLSLRIAPELFLKRLIIGGAERIFELGKAFRNEGIDRQHNPEFTLCELYVAYATVEDLLPLTERLVVELVTAIQGSPQITYQGQAINLTPPWPAITFIEAIEHAAGVHVLRERDPAVYLRALERLGASRPADQSLPHLMDELLTEAVRKKTTGPLVIWDAPTELFPLAKRKPREPALVQRFSLIVAGMELVNAYTEENDPAEQESRFREQARLRGETEIYPLDADYLEALKVGLPPTAGWGLGVDRLVMLAANQRSIRDVIAFPLLRPRTTH